MKTPRGARTLACRVHTHVNALKIVSATLCSEECEHGTHECARHGGVFNGAGAWGDSFTHSTKEPAVYFIRGSECVT
jgi:hypothetical protein